MVGGWGTTPASSLWGWLPGRPQPWPGSRLWVLHLPPLCLDQEGNCSPTSQVYSYTLSTKSF